ncbi:MAG: cyclase family protein [Ignavibacteriaceae bacterium]
MLLLSHILKSDSPSYGDRDNFKIEIRTSVINGDTSNTSSWYFSSNHFGTHIDAPYHFNETGKKTYEYSADYWYFSKISFIDLPLNKSHLISVKDLIKYNLQIDTEILLIRTGYEKYRNKRKYIFDNPGIHSDLAEYFRNNYPMLRCIGFDFISLTSWNDKHDGQMSHRNFLISPNNGGEILIIEDMSLKNIKNKLKWLIVSPLFVFDGNGGPVTIFAKESE